MSFYFCDPEVLLWCLTPLAKVRILPSLCESLHIFHFFFLSLQEGFYFRSMPLSGIITMCMVIINVGYE